MKRQSLALLLGSLCAMSAFATTYVRVEKDGTKTYSDRPIPGGQVVDLQPAQTYSAPPPVSGSDRPNEAELLRRTDDFRYQSCSVTPQNDETFQSPESVLITVSTNPPLRDSDVVTMTVDGQAAGPPNSMSYTMSPAYRGTHTVSVKVTNPKGQTLCTSTSAFHVQQIGVNSPARRQSAPRPTPH